ncbi:class F sortase [Streptomyces xanthophaeus]|uniref:class F sortase n=1 Tax=Streptomyces xanthophaeus TaxID=67385 RepID=UPI00398FA249
MEKAKPAKLRIAAAGVNAGPVLELAPEHRKGEMIPEKQAGSPGWFTDTATPGEKGVAVLVARYGTAGGPGLMKNVNKVRVGDPIQVDRVDGTTAAFKITQIQQVTDETPPQKKEKEKEKGKPSPQAELRVIALGVPMEEPKASKEDKKKDEDKEDAKNPDGPRTSNVVFFAELVK